MSDVSYRAALDIRHHVDMDENDLSQMDDETLISWIQGCAWMMTLAYERQDWKLFGEARRELDVLRVLGRQTKCYDVIAVFRIHVGLNNDSHACRELRFHRIAFDDQRERVPLDRHIGFDPFVCVTRLVIVYDFAEVASVHERDDRHTVANICCRQRITQQAKAVEMCAYADAEC